MIKKIKKKQYTRLKCKNNQLKSQRKIEETNMLFEKINKIYKTLAALITNKRGKTYYHYQE